MNIISKIVDVLKSLARGPEPASVDRATTIDTVVVRSVGAAVIYTAGMEFDVDGAPNAYHPPTATSPHGCPPGLDDLRNAGYPGNDCGVIVVDGKLLTQGLGDPCPGFCVSTSALGDANKYDYDPLKYVDATRIPYVSIPGRIAALRTSPSFYSIFKVGVGDLAMVFYKDATSPAIVAEVGPGGKIGEGSIALAAALGLYKGRVNDGHDSKDVTYVLFPGSALTPRWPQTLDAIRLAATTRFAAWGGLNHLQLVKGS